MQLVVIQVLEICQVRCQHLNSSSPAMNKAECHNVKERAPNSMAESHTNQWTCTTEEWSFSWSLEMTDTYRLRTR
uniref:Uncharacterized protein n=1 Tax=Oryza nivara TaxID=4536 RepID=A0A0E0I4R7_ORYNI